MNYRRTDHQVEEYRAIGRYHRHWARRLNFTGWIFFGLAIAQHVRHDTDGAWALLLIGAGICWAWRFYEEGKEREAREDLWEYVNENMEVFHKWERGQ